VAILMACYNGAAYLQEQLDSIAAQTVDWVLLASDDGSTDETLAELERFRSRFGAERVVIRRGPARGFVANFLSMACQPVFETAYFAFCDQDDIWMPDKLERALDVLLPLDSQQPLLYGGRTALVDDDGNPLGMSPLFRHPPCFRNALVQSLAGANTMVFNEKARQLYVAAGADVSVASHDWWLYLLVTGAGGRMHYDPLPAIRYRQHSENVIGCNIGWKAKWWRFMRLLDGQLQVWSDMHVAALNRVEDRLTPENREIFEKFKAGRSKRGIACAWALLKIRLFRQTLVGNIGLYVSALLGKI